MEVRLKYTEIGQVRKQKQQAQTTQLWRVEESTTAAGEGSNVKEEDQIVKGRLDEQGCLNVENWRSEMEGLSLLYRREVKGEGKRIKSIGLFTGL